jgi:hypothetical protein
MHNIVDAAHGIVKETGVETIAFPVEIWYTGGKRLGDGRLQLDLGCPVELLGYDLTHDERGVKGFVRLHNLSDHPVTGFEAVITWQGDGGSADIPLMAGPILAAPHEPFVLPLEAEAAPNGHWSGLFFVQVDFDGAPPWRGNPRRLTEVVLPEKPSPLELEALRRVAGPDAAVRPHDAGAYWVCACGRANPGHSPGCDRCGRSRRHCLKLSRQLAEAFKQEISGTPPKSAKVPRPEPEAAFHVTLRAKYLRQKNMLIRRTITMLTAAALIGLIALLWTWLIGMQQRAKDIVPPTRIEETINPQTSASP